MKKRTLIMSCAVVALAASLSSCGKCDKNCQNDPYTFSKAQSDSLSIAYGKAIGLYLNENLREYQAHSGQGYDKEEFVKGLQYILTKDNNEAFNAGAYSAMQMLGDIKKFEEKGAKIDMSLLMREMRRCILADSVSDGQTALAQAELRSIDNKLEDMAMKRHLEEVTNSPEAKENLKNAEAFVKQLKAQQPSLVNQGDSILYVVETPGTGAAAAEGQLVVADVTMSTLKGRTVRQNKDMSINPAHKIPGIAEGAKATGVGGTVKVYVDGKTAFGPEGSPQLNIGPNEMVCYTIVVKDITTPNIK
jgi:FKBP-type peptidyl-prolyl cis-trans isomerase